MKKLIEINIYKGGDLQITSFKKNKKAADAFIARNTPNAIDFDIEQWRVVIN